MEDERDADRLHRERPAATADTQWGCGRDSHHIQAARSPHLQQSQVNSACRRNIVQGLVSTLLFETAQALRCVHRRLTVFLHNGGASSARVCLSGLALESDRRPARGTGVVTEAGYATNFQPR